MTIVVTLKYGLGSFSLNHFLAFPAEGQHDCRSASTHRVNINLSEISDKNRKSLFYDRIQEYLRANKLSKTDATSMTVKEVRLILEKNLEMSLLDHVAQIKNAMILAIMKLNNKGTDDGSSSDSSSSDSSSSENDSDDDVKNRKKHTTKAKKDIKGSKPDIRDTKKVQSREKSMERVEQRPSERPRSRNNDPGSNGSRKSEKSALSQKDSKNGIRKTATNGISKDDAKDKDRERKKANGTLRKKTSTSSGGDSQDGKRKSGSAKNDLVKKESVKRESIRSDKDDSKDKKRAKVRDREREKERSASRNGSRLSNKKSSKNGSGSANTEGDPKHRIVTASTTSSAQADEEKGRTSSGNLKRKRSESTDDSENPRELKSSRTGTLKKTSKSELKNVVISATSTSNGDAKSKKKANTLVLKLSGPRSLGSPNSKKTSSRSLSAKNSLVTRTASGLGPMKYSRSLSTSGGVETKPRKLNSSSKHSDSDSYDKPKSSRLKTDRGEKGGDSGKKGSGSTSTGAIATVATHEDDIVMGGTSSSSAKVSSAKRGAESKSADRTPKRESIDEPDVDGTGTGTGTGPAGGTGSGSTYSGKAKGRGNCLSIAELKDMQAKIAQTKGALIADIVDMIRSSNVRTLKDTPPGMCVSFDLSEMDAAQIQKLSSMLALR
ncbi:hypothetical protein SARC_08470 [Sphaeroforma arctica JP610]|uniref:Uncharacterized protein n=1 Tax=Sphaeroforma arctica JP610 TaxID=667725 RepID=A0A0L0FRF1_9EUKA|nr:hypothetical protein SARC_08470 [Sphaeroforma arctica JP610]KNC79121.1 hypothetical protein SARC_08470 [Sphaeroforma arctica JP610]|eukprot:XP_014153023.1 hypothetical protein SARC_08470 [Sphaeroforma arctica JP610]